jgi:hypothetical protein
VFGSKKTNPKKPLSFPLKFLPFIGSKPLNFPIKTHFPYAQAILFRRLVSGFAPIHRIFRNERPSRASSELDHFKNDYSPVFAISVIFAVKTHRASFIRPIEMLRTCCGLVAEMLRIKSLTVSDVADVAGFQTSCHHRPPNVCASAA